MDRYGQAWALLDHHEAAVGQQLLTEEERDWVFGRTLATLFPGAFTADVPAKAGDIDNGSVCSAI